MEFNDEWTTFYDKIRVSRWDKEQEKKVKIPGIGVAKFVERNGGYEDEGSYMDVIFKVNDRFFRKVGTYDSWDSDEWDGALEEVVQKEVLKTVWERV